MKNNVHFGEESVYQ